MDNELPLAPMAPLSVDRPQPTPIDILQAAIAGGVTEQNVAVVERLSALAERFEQRNAEKEFSAAFSAMQSEMPVITASTPIKNRGKYEKFEDLMHKLAPLLARHGFSVSFSQSFEVNRIVETCKLRHKGGHSESNSFSVRTRPADNDTQSDCMAATTAKRNALCNALNIVIRQDVLNEEDDPRMQSDKLITKEQAEELERRVVEKNRDRKQFLMYAGAPSFDKIPAAMYDDLDQMLTRAKSL